MTEKNENLSSSIQFDTSTYKSGISELNRQMRVLESGFRATAAGMDDWSKSATGLESRNKTLADQIEIQRQKLAGLSKVYEELAADEKTSQKAKDEMQIKINKETESLAKLESELRGNEKALSEMGNESKDAGNKVKELGDKQAETTGKTEGFKSALSGMGTAIKGLGIAAASVGAAVAGIGAAVGKMVLGSAKSADELSELSAKTGLTTTQLQELSFIGKQVGTDVETVTGSMARLIRNMNGAREGTGTAAEAFKNLGVPITDVNGNLRNSKTVFSEALQSLGKMSNETERDAAAMAIFGKSAMELNPLIKTSKEEMDLMTQQAHELGAVMSEENVSALGEFQDTLDGLQDGLKGTVGTLAASFLPAFKGVGSKVTGYMKDLSGIVSGSNGDLGKMAGGIGQLVGSIATDIAKQGPQMLQAGLGILQGIITAIISNLPTLLPAVIQMVMSLVNFIVQNLPMLITAAMQIIVALAQGLGQTLPTLIPTIVGIIPVIVTTLLQNLPLLISAAAQLLIGLAYGIGAAIPVLLESVPGILIALKDALIIGVPMLGKAALAIVLALGMGIQDRGADMIKAAKILIDKFISGVKELYNTITSIGSSIVDGVWKGIQDSYSNFKDQVESFFKDIVETVKDVLGIASPSKVMKSIGVNMANGLGLGFFDQMKDVQNKIERMFQTSFGMGFGQFGAFATAGSSNESWTFYGPVNISGSAGQRMNEMVKQSRW